MWIFIVGLAVFILGAIGVAVWRALQFKKLAERGVPVTGTVVHRFQSGKAGGPERTKRITYSYTGPDGREYQRSASMTRGRWEQYPEGAPIQLICLPDDPGVSAEATLVAAARAALAAKKP
jgi:hypothetical protein